MTRFLDRLTARQVTTLKPKPPATSAMFADGDGLYLQVKLKFDAKGKPTGESNRMLRDKRHDLWPSSPHASPVEVWQRAKLHKAQAWISWSVIAPVLSLEH
jgi:hypothetical protein